MRPPALLLLLLAAPAAAIDPALLAPTGPELQAALRAQEARGQRVAALQEATARLHNTWAQAGWLEGRQPLCGTPEAESVAARARVFGAALREAAQSMRVHQDRVEHMARSPSAAPLLGAEGAAALTALRTATDAHATAYRELVAWQERFIEPRLRGCSPALAEAVGLSGLRTPEGPVALAGIGGGRLCPMDAPADGSVWIAPTGRACYSAGPCGCAPEPVEPGAVLGPGQPTSPPQAAPALALPAEPALVPP